MSVKENPSLLSQKFIDTLKLKTHNIPVDELFSPRQVAPLKRRTTENTNKLTLLLPDSARLSHQKYQLTPRRTLSHRGRIERNLSSTTEKQNDDDGKVVQQSDLWKTKHLKQGGRTVRKKHIPIDTLQEDILLKIFSFMIFGVQKMEDCMTKLVILGVNEPKPIPTPHALQLFYLRQVSKRIHRVITKILVNTEVKWARSTFVLKNFASFEGDAWIQIPIHIGMVKSIKLKCNHVLDKHGKFVWKWESGAQLVKLIPKTSDFGFTYSYSQTDSRSMSLITF